jgi:hypothetical protein
MTRSLPGYRADMGEPGAATTVLRTYHGRVEQMLERFTAESDAGPLPPHLRGKLLLELVRHEVMETLFLFPAVEDALPGTDGITGYGLRELGRLHELMVQVEAMPPEDRRFPELSHQLRTEFRRHAEDQDSGLFPRLEEEMSSAELKRLGQRLNPTAESGSTQAHPNTSEGEPPLLEPRPGLVDELRSRVIASEFAG